MVAMYRDNLQFQAKQFIFTETNYNIRFLELLNQIYISYGLMIEDKVSLVNMENNIRDVLVKDYLIPNIEKYQFTNEKSNGDGRFDIYISQDLKNSKPEFIIECKRLDDKQPKSRDKLNGKYVSNGIQRFLTEHYYLENNFNINAIIGFVVAKIDIEENIKSINELTKKILNNFVEIKKDIAKYENDIYKSSYKTTALEIKNFHIYHLMMDFSNNIRG